MKPHHWPWVALGISAAAAIAAVVVIGSKSPAVNMPIMLGVPFVATYVTHLVSRRAPNKVLFEFRVDRRPSWYTDAVEVTDRGLEITAVSGAGRMAQGPTKLSFGFNELLGIGTRAAVPGEAPWITLSDGRGLPVPDGDVVVLRTTAGEQVLPVEEPHKFVSLVRSRVSGLPDVHSAAVAGNGHVAEVGTPPPSTGERTTPVQGPATSNAGPSLAVRWLVGATLALTGTVVLPAIALVVAHVPWIVLGWVGIAGVVWVLNRNVPRVWGRVALLSVPLSVFWLLGKHAYIWIPVLALCPVLGYLGGRMFRLGAGLGKNVEVRVPLRDGASLYVQRDRLLYKLNKSKHGGVHPQALWLGDLTLVQPGSAQDLQAWPIPGGVKMPVGASPMLRLVAPPQQWILPVNEASELAELIKSRQGVPSHPTPLSIQEWRELRSWAALRTTGTDRGNYKTVGIGWRLFVAAVAGNFGWMFLSTKLWPGAAFALGLAVVLPANWWRVRERMRVAEHNVLPPDSPDWGETRPDHAPIPGWQPYFC
ncbi:hypothetical protein Lesp02_35800 [Lentzea sp. NBRC 105346]|uniref:hypothetical protein n=1 Tax=Lentzea sp. NBRC 105346 TaxID=3032205 RepID=UPI00249FCDE6|nr:hypothetical protein [Lentzea sp. NBRC 105346]GLZ31392.1 hypothetical protein Lesp02_35800 [Lentzea sp. NBRC 105346]